MRSRTASRRAPATPISASSRLAARSVTSSPAVPRGDSPDGLRTGHDRVVYVHLTLVPYIATSAEIKTKPTQHSVKEIRSIGIQPDILVCRSEKMLPDEQRRKIALFTNVQEKAVISAYDVDDSIQDSGNHACAGPWRHRCRAAASWICRRLISVEWQKIVEAKQNTVAEVDIAMVGKYVDLRDAYISLSEALLHGGIHTVPASTFTISNRRISRRMALIVCKRWTVSSSRAASAIVALKARSLPFAMPGKQTPYLGICLGMQVALSKLPGIWRTRWRAQYRIRARHRTPGCGADHGMGNQRR